MKRADLAAATARWRNDICAFVEQVLIDSDTGEHFTLYPEQREFLSLAFKLTPDGRMPYTELCYSAPKRREKLLLQRSSSFSPRFT
jgi:hypothetical protein